MKLIILDLYYQLKDYHENSFLVTPIEEFEPLFETLNDLVHLPMGDHMIKLLSEDREIISILPVIRRFYGNFLFYQEIDLAKKILSASNPWQSLYSYSLFSRYQKLTSNQGKGANLKTGDTVAFIGGGAVPITLILLQELFGITGTSIEMQPEIAITSRKVIEKLGLSEVITTITGDETSIEGRQFSAIMVAALAQPKRRIFQRLRTILDERSDVSVSYRTYSGMRILLYDSVKESDYEGFREIKRIQPVDTVNNTVCFIKKIS